MRTSLDPNLHAKCCLNERYAIVTSMHLDFSQRNNTEMGVLADRDENGAL